MSPLRRANSTTCRRPLGYLGLIFTFTTALLTRFLAAWFIGVVGFADQRLRRYFYLLPVRDLLSFVIWCASFCGTTVYWCGERYRLLPGGTLLPRSGDGAAPLP